MYPSLTPSQERAYNRTLTGLSSKRIKVSLLDRSGDTVANLTPYFTGNGQVVMDARADVTRAGTFEIIDLKRAFGFDADTYQGGDLDLTRMIRAWWVTDGALLANYVSVPIFTGPVTRLTRKGPVVTIEAQSKEVYGLGTGHRTKTVRKGARKVDALRAIARDMMGETRLAIPDLKAKLSANVVVRPQDQPWKVMQRIAHSMGKQLYYDGAGVLRLRELPAKVAWSFSSGAGGSIVSDIEVAADLTEVINRVRVVGRTPKATKANRRPKPFSAVATAPRNHPLSPWQLGPPGAPMFKTEEVQNDQCRSNGECAKVARARLERGLTLTRSLAFDSVPIPFLEPLDKVLVRTDHESVTMRLETFTLPLGASGVMQVGYTGGYRLRKLRRKPKPKPTRNNTGGGAGLSWQPSQGASR